VERLAENLALFSQYKDGPSVPRYPRGPLSNTFIISTERAGGFWFGGLHCRVGGGGSRVPVGEFFSLVVWEAGGAVLPSAD